MISEYKTWSDILNPGSKIPGQRKRMLSVQYSNTKSCNFNNFKDCHSNNIYT